ncbi:hypothetical protein [Pseudomonas paralcaligenes]|uniref:hypothetical protein n=1 Tax=Pseudomonas paralcaligenes TaxID=2772558 RepID=UPI001C7F91C1|nr:hypothetical protein [Pseudomonas paralcaligenes]
MGANYSFEITFDRERIDNIIECLIDTVCHSDKKALKKCIPWRPATEFTGKLANGSSSDYSGTGFDQLKRKDNHYHLTLSMPNTSDLAADLEAHDFEHSESQPFSSIGYVWASIHVGKKWGILTLTASTSIMSSLFHSSYTIKNFIVDTFSPQSSFVLLDTEEEFYLMLYPATKRIEPGKHEDYCFEPSYEYSPDAFVEKINESLKAP